MVEILVTGAAGFIGAKAAQYLADQGHTVAGIDTKPEHIVSPPDGWVLEQISVRAWLDAWHAGKVRKKEDGKAWPDVIVHCACVDQLEAYYSPADSFEVNYLDTTNLVELGIPIVYTGTVSHFNRDGFHNPYAKDKKAAEEFIVAHAAPDSTVLRLSNVFGPGMRLFSPNCGFIGKVTTSVLYGWPLSITAPSLQRRYTYIDRVVEAIEQAVQESKHGRLLGEGVTYRLLPGQRVANIIGSANLTPLDVLAESLLAREQLAQRLPAKAFNVDFTKDPRPIDARRNDIPTNLINDGGFYSDLQATLLWAQADFEEQERSHRSRFFASTDGPRAAA